MSSMHRTSLAFVPLMLAFSTAVALAQPAPSDGSEWDVARARLQTAPSGNMAMAISRWKLLNASDRFLFSDYSSFLLSYPGFPEEGKLRLSAERALDREMVEPARIAAYFDRFTPLSNPARARYALALFALGRPQAREIGLEAWRGGYMSDTAQASLFPLLASSLTPTDHDLRMDALLWASATAPVEQQILYVSPAARNGFLVRLGLLNSKDPLANGVAPPADALKDAGYIYNRTRMLRTGGNAAAAANLLASRPILGRPPREPRRWIAELLATARAAGAGSAVQIAGGVDDIFPAGTDVSAQPFAIRDDYTSLMWLGGTKALRVLGDGARAAPLFWRYGAAARTPQTRAKGFYWAGRAMAQTGNATEAARYFEMAAAYPDQFYGMLALERLGRPLPAFAGAPAIIPDSVQRSTFNARPLTYAVREVAREGDWQTTVRFFREICEQAQGEAEHVLIADLARELGRRDLGVILGQSAHADGHGNFQKISFPLIPIPSGANWTMVHAISRQESQFAQNAISHAGARGLMQLMPGTAREQSHKMGMSYDLRALTGDAGYNMLLGDAYFRRMLDYYGGSYPLAVAAYNAGPGNVNRWLSSNGDPRNGSVDWIDWIERIPLSETRGYVQHVLENAVVYEAMNPGRARLGGGNPLSRFLGKGHPG